jgi:hypothetical protein
VDWNNPWNVRHQPVSFSQSACFRNSNGGFSCLTCHDPHQPLSTDQAAYNSKCQACHNPAEHPAAGQESRNCVGCHMPRVVPQSYLRFTNHWIGVYRNGSGLKPVR